MKVNQIYSILNDINKQLWGKDAVDVNNLAGLVSMGKTVMSSSDNMDKFINKLVDRIGKTVVRTLDLELDFPALFMDSFTFGAVLQKITVNPFDSIENAEWEVGADDFEPTFADIHKCDIVVSYFTGVDTWKFQRTIPDNLFDSAFTSETSMGNFIDAIIKAMNDSMVMSINNMSQTAVNNFIAEKIKVNNGVINLLSGYNNMVGAGNTITADKAMYNKDFMRYAVNEIRKYIKYLNKPSYLYNTGVIENGATTPVLRATARDNMHVIFNTWFTSAVESYLESDTFHNELVKLPLYTEVPYWQGNKGENTVNDFTTNTSIKVVPSSEEGKDDPTDVEASGVIGLLADRQAIAVGINKQRNGAFRNDIDAYTNVSASATKMFINDLSENGIIFIVADDETP